MLTKEEMHMFSRIYRRLEVAYKDFLKQYCFGFGGSAKPINEEELNKIRVLRLRVDAAKSKSKEARVLYYYTN